MSQPSLLKILVCPETRQPLEPAKPDLLSRLNAAIRTGGLKTRGGSAVEKPIDGGLVRADGKVLYAIRDSIPMMLVDEAIVLDPAMLQPPSESLP